MKGLLLFSLMLLSGAAVAQNVGIGTTLPLAGLHVNDRPVLFQGVFGAVPASPAPPPISGRGSRIMWYIDKVAFRAGHAGNLIVGGTEFFFDPTTWDGDNIGVGSVAMGVGTKASGMFSTAIGRGTLADGNTSTATGIGSKALGRISTATGILTVATGNASTAMGDRTSSYPYASLVIGRFNDSVLSSSPIVWVETDPVFIIGNGADSLNRSNAFVVHKNGNTTIQGSVTVNKDAIIQGNSVVTGEMRRVATGAANLAPIAFGSISSVAGINGGSGNFTVATTATGIYEITITGESYTTSAYMTTVTPIGGSAFRVATTTAAGGKLVIRIFDSGGNLTSNTAAFNFVVFKP